MNIVHGQFVRRGTLLQLSVFDLGLGLGKTVGPEHQEPYPPLHPFVVGSLEDVIELGIGAFLEEIVDAFAYPIFAPSWAASLVAPALIILILDEFRSRSKTLLARVSGEQRCGIELVGLRHMRRCFRRWRERGLQSKFQRLRHL
ncbi:MAG: hypothetical protein HZB91_12560 [Elusimicrobia bacterium]|nr:hypothetical protein [Elusimicrobiota bacterium]